MVYYVSDMYFDCEDKAKARHFSSVSDMNNLIISNWNRIIYPTDEVYILGGIGNFDYLNSLNGEKIIVMSDNETEHFLRYIESVSSDRNEDIDYEIYEDYLKSQYNIKRLCKSGKVTKKLYSGRLVKLCTKRIKTRDNTPEIIGGINDLQRMFSPTGINSDILVNGYFPLSELDIEDLLHSFSKLII